MFELLVLDKTFTAVTIIDEFESMIWADRYNERGDFELYLVMDEKYLKTLKRGYYLWFAESEHQMIIEKLQTQSDTEIGNHLTVTGRSLESILDRRIIWTQTEFKGYLQDAIEKMLNDAIIKPTDASRKIANFRFVRSTDPKITALKVDTQRTGTNLYDTIVELTSKNNIGFKVTLSEDNYFEFRLYAGTDRSYAQIENPYVIFAPNFDNLLNSNYLEDDQNLRNVALVAGEGQAEERKKVTLGSASGLDRRELYVDARDLTTWQENGETMPDNEYLEKLKTRGTSKLSEYNSKVDFEGEVEGTQMFKYGIDYYMGDIVQVADEYTHEAQCYIAELIFSESEEGKSIYPTFKTVQKEEDQS